MKIVVGRGEPVEVTGRQMIELIASGARPAEPRVSLTPRQRFLVAAATSQGYSPIEIGEYVLSVRGEQIAAEAVAYSRRVLFGLAKERAVNERWRKAPASAEDVSTFLGQLDQYLS